MIYSPHLEWALAAQWWGITPSQFRLYDGDEQSEMVAAYRVHHQMEAVVAKAQADESKRRTRK